MTEKEILEALGLTEDDFCRYRSAYETEDNYVVHTRDGGGCGCTGASVFKHPLYECNIDQEDYTYVDYYFYKKVEN